MAQSMKSASLVSISLVKAFTTMMQLARCAMRRSEMQCQADDPGNIPVSRGMDPEILRIFMTGHYNPVIGSHANQLILKY